MKVYKFSKLAHLKKASFRLGTLYDYRKQEEYGNNIGDPKEGHFKINFDYKKNFSITDEELSSITKLQDFGFAFVRGHTQNKSHDFVAFTPSNVLVFSATKIYDASLFKEFDNSDLCYEITNFQKFCEEIVRSIKLPIKKWAIKECIYEEKEVVNSYSPIPSITFLKEPKYKTQREVRLCIELEDNETTPVIQKSKRALKYCKRKKII